MSPLLHSYTQRRHKTNEGRERERGARASALVFRIRKSIRSSSSGKKAHNKSMQYYSQAVIKVLISIYALSPRWFLYWTSFNVANRIIFPFEYMWSCGWANAWKRPPIFTINALHHWRSFSLSKSVDSTIRIHIIIERICYFSLSLPPQPSAIPCVHRENDAPIEIVGREHRSFPTQSSVQNWF